MELRDTFGAARNGLLACLRELIDTRHAGRVTKRHLHELRTVGRPAADVR
ncbi:hypothetical protein [Streptomyces sp. NPDC054842]